AVWMWGNLFIQNLKGDEHIIIDGTPRSINEARVLDSAVRFYKRQPAKVIYLNVSRAWAEQRLHDRGRTDDRSLLEVKKRLDWFETDVLPAVNHLREHSEYQFLDINGEQPLEEVHQEIIKKIELQK
ncbi:MAG: nucleoside monophosphate kinase, partial [Candidatus Yonathbacteria bacterium]|nr:nucleoside monophosphate kinase [Candidatus Yonathbacteria bacterium]